MLTTSLLQFMGSICIILVSRKSSTSDLSRIVSSDCMICSYSSDASQSSRLQCQSALQFIPYWRNGAGPSSGPRSGPDRRPAGGEMSGGNIRGARLSAPPPRRRRCCKSIVGGSPRLGRTQGAAPLWRARPRRGLASLREDAKRASGERRKWRWSRVCGGQQHLASRLLASLEHEGGAGSRPWNMPNTHAPLLHRGRRVPQRLSSKRKFVCQFCLCLGGARVGGAAAQPCGK